MTGQLHVDLEAGVMELFERLKDHHEILWGPEVYSYGPPGVLDPGPKRLPTRFQRTDKREADL